MTPRGKGKFNEWTREDVIAEIQHFALMEGTEPYAPTIGKKAPELEAMHAAAKRLFGSWPEAVEAAGLKIRDPQ